MKYVYIATMLGGLSLFATKDHDNQAYATEKERETKAILLNACLSNEQDRPVISELVSLELKYLFLLDWPSTPSVPTELEGLREKLNLKKVNQAKHAAKWTHRSLAFHKLKQQKEAAGLPVSYEMFRKLIGVQKNGPEKDAEFIAFCKKYPEYDASYQEIVADPSLPTPELTSAEELLREDTRLMWSGWKKEVAAAQHERIKKWLDDRSRQRAIERQPEIARSQHEWELKCLAFRKLRKQKRLAGLQLPETMFGEFALLPVQTIVAKKESAFAEFCERYPEYNSIYQELVEKDKAATLPV